MCALLLVLGQSLTHLHRAGLANCLGRMTLYPPRSFTATRRSINEGCDLGVCYNNNML